MGTTSKANGQHQTQPAPNRPRRPTPRTQPGSPRFIFFAQILNAAQLNAAKISLDYLTRALPPAQTIALNAAKILLGFSTRPQPPAQTNALNAAKITKAQSIAVAGVVLAVLLAVVAIIIAAVWIAKVGGGVCVCFTVHGAGWGTWDLI